MLFICVQRNGVTSGDILVAGDFPDELSETEYRDFWISWENLTQISVGRGTNFELLSSKVSSTSHG